MTCILTFGQDVSSHAALPLDVAQPFPAEVYWNGVPFPTLLTSDVLAADPEIDRSPIWAVVYGRYLWLLGREMFWPDISRQERFRIAIVNWPDLAEDLGQQLDGRAIAGIPVEVTSLTPKELAGEKQDFTMLFIGGTGDASALAGLTAQLGKWTKRDRRTALVLTDGADVEGADVVFRRLKQEQGLSLCIATDQASLASKALNLPLHFMQRACP
ncbi:MAG: hypothetical protein ISP55_00740 [Flavobacteriales bacterium]|nr:hypothetical protein [Flavobacteriales bacterium]